MKANKTCQPYSLLHMISSSRGAHFSCPPLSQVQLYARDVASSLCKGGVDSLVDFTWQRTLRCSLDASAQSALVEMGSSTLRYGYEFCGGQPAPALTALGERGLFWLLSLVGRGVGGHLIGPPGACALQVESVAALLGQLMVANVVTSECNLAQVEYDIGIEIRSR